MEKDKNIISMGQFVELYNKEIWPLVKKMMPEIKKHFIFNKRNKKLVTLKRKCMEKVLGFFGEDIHWENEKIMDDKALYRSKLFPAFAHYNVDDAFYGSYKGVDFKISEASLTGEITSPNDILSNYMPIFKGVILSFASNKKIKKGAIVSTKYNRTIKADEGNLRFYSIVYNIAPIFAFIIFCLYLYTAWHSDDIFEKIICVFMLSCFIISVPIWYLISHGDKKSADYWMQQKLGTVNDTSKMQKVTLEDPLWNKRFDVYAENQVEARYLLTTGFMERFYNLKTAFGARQLKCSFYDDQLMIAISTDEDVFEFWDLKSPYKVYKQLSSILNLIEYFKLNEKTGL